MEKKIDYLRVSVMQDTALVERAATEVIETGTRLQFTATGLILYH